ncbi:MAG: hypothetical protein WCT04_24070 [Planctomycetota bacterium]
MRMVKFVVPFLLALFLSCAQGAEKKEGGGIHGELAAAPAGSAAGVVGVVTVKGHAKKGAEAPAPKVYNIVADGDLAKKVAELVGKDVDIKGSGEMTSFKLETIAEHMKKAK